MDVGSPATSRGSRITGEAESHYGFHPHLYWHERSRYLLLHQHLLWATPCGLASEDRAPVVGKALAFLVSPCSHPNTERMAASDGGGGGGLVR